MNDIRSDCNENDGANPQTDNRAQRLVEWNQNHLTNEARNDTNEGCKP